MAKQYGIDFGTAKPVKASIWNEDKNQKVVDCMFNPTEYTFSRTNRWTESAATRTDVALPTFSGSNPITLSVSNLVFDTYALASDEPTPEDVRTFEKFLGDASGTDLSRLAWLHLNIQDDATARSVVTKALAEDFSNEHLVKLAKRLEIEGV